MINTGLTLRFFLMTMLTLAVLAAPAKAQPVPGPADAGRIESFPGRDMLPAIPQQQPEIPGLPAAGSPPESADEITLVLNGIRLEGVTAFEKDEIEKLYRKDIGQEIKLTKIWEIAEKITRLYRQNEYFLSRAYVPAQEIEDGFVTIRVVEGYVARIVQDEELADKRIMKKYSRQIIASRPLRARDLESFLLRLNDLPGVSFRGVIEAMPGAPAEGMTQLNLVRADKKGAGSITVDNYGSRFLGPYIATASWKDSFFTMQDTSITLSASLPMNELKNISITHTVPVQPKWKFEASGSYVKAFPGYTLKPQEIESDSASVGFALIYQPVRQWNENLSFTLRMEGKNTDSTIVGTPLTRDRIRSLSAGVSYDRADRWSGYNYMGMTVTQGLNILGASKAGEINLSREEAEPGFTKLDGHYIRQQNLGGSVLMTAQIHGQVASGPLYSSEEFGYGGPSLGRAYDPSEITGDHGIKTGIEFRYLGIKPAFGTKISPFVFYDIGKVWNEDSDGGHESASAAGLGANLRHEKGFSATFTMAQPLTRASDAPPYGNGKNPEYLFQLGYNF